MPSYYGKGPYGKALYSRANVWNLAGGLRPAVALTGTLRRILLLGGDLSPSIVFSANLAVEHLVSLSGDFAPQTALGASLTGDWVLAGDMTSGIVLAAQLVTGPLWQGSTTCPPSTWEDSEMCPPSIWTPIIPPDWAPSGAKDPLGYGMRAYGVGEYNEFVSPWVPTELCNG
jgi:hypothetical protein